MTPRNGLAPTQPRPLRTGTVTVQDLWHAEQAAAQVALRLEGARLRAAETEHASRLADAAFVGTRGQSDAEVARLGDAAQHCGDASSQAARTCAQTETELKTWLGQLAQLRTRAAPAVLEGAGLRPLHFAMFDLLRGQGEETCSERAQALIEAPLRPFSLFRGVVMIGVSEAWPGGHLGRVVGYQAPQGRLCPATLQVLLLGRDRAAAAFTLDQFHYGACTVLDALATQERQHLYLN